jgi:5-methylcytosine-specific restriction endonuclease McrA
MDRRFRRIAVFQKYGGRCAYCGDHVSVASMEVDHIHPRAQRHLVSLESFENLENLHPACRPCNRTKGNRNLEDFRTHIRRLRNDLITSKRYECLSQMALYVVNQWDGKFFFEQVPGCEEDSQD